MTIQKQLYLAFASICSILVLTMVVGLFSIQRISDTVKDLAGRSEDATYYAGQIDTITSDLQAEQRGMLMRRMLNETAPSDKLITDDVASMAALRRFVTLYEELNLPAEVSSKLHSLSDHLSTAERLNPEYLELVRHSDFAGAAKYLDQGLSDADDSASAEGAELLDQQQQLARADGTARIAQARRAMLLMLAMTVPLVLASFFLFRVISAMTVKLREAIFQFADAAREIAETSEQVAQSSISFAQGVEQQRGAVEATSTASVAIAALAQRSSEDSRKAVDMVQSSQKAFREADDSLNDLVHAMEGVTESSNKISKINKVIDEIAFQTNILALNAAVEAARAGESGLGFAVVADEVRSLAQRCSQAAKDTAGLIEESVERAAGGRVKVHQVATVTHDATSESTKIEGLISQIDSASQEQSTGIGRISAAIQQMETFSASGASGAKQGAMAAEQLSKQAVSLHDALGRLKDLVDRRKGPGIAPRDARGMAVERRRRAA